MSLSKFAFIVFCSFIVGVALLEFGTPLFMILFINAVPVSALFFWSVYTHRRVWALAGVGLMTVAVGAVYGAVWNAYYFDNPAVVYGANKTMTGTVVSSPRAFSTQNNMLVKTQEGATISVWLDSSITIGYGDVLRLRGDMTSPKEDQTYLRPQKVVGVMDDPVILSRTPYSGLSLHHTLYAVRDKFVDVFSHTLSYNNAALMSGILLGKTSTSFPKKLKDAMVNSGTTHLVALSGYNVMIVVDAIFLALTFVVSRKRAGPLAIVAVVLFVMMTGAQASVVRAAIMGGLVIFSELFSRVYNFANASASTAFVMIVLNPAIVRFDVGFILSFFALFGVVWGVSVMRNLSRAKEGWWFGTKKIIAETASAQAMVLPVLALSFGRFSLVALFSNILILPLISLTMGIGFVVGIIGLLSLPLAGICSLVLSPLLSFHVWVMKTFGSLYASHISFGILSVVVYYAVLLTVMYYLYGYSKRYAYVC